MDDSQIMSLRRARKELEQHTKRLSAIINNQRSPIPGVKTSTPQEVEQAKQERDKLHAASLTGDPAVIYAAIERLMQTMPPKQKVVPKSQSEIDNELLQKLENSRRK